MNLEKPKVYMRGGRWYLRAGLGADWRNVAAAQWIDRRNYFIGIRAGIKLGQALDCTARGCPVPQAYNPEGWQQPTGQELGYGPYN